MMFYFTHANDYLSHISNDPCVANVVLSYASSGATIYIIIVLLGGRF